ncbi:dienelactone hydrolase family protein [Pseudomonas syringae]|nr:dienelactone hydrolase family protein [Pseudomonas syringae]
MLKVFAFMLFAMCGLAQAGQPLLRDLPLAYVEQASTEVKDKPLVIFLHGYGGDETNLLSFTSLMPSDYNYLSVRAPMNAREEGYQWFTPKRDSAYYDGVTSDLESSGQLLKQFIEQATSKYQTQPSKVFLVGFSQGAMMSYEVALRDPGLVGGFAALSGHMLPVLKAELKPDPTLRKLAVFIGHGTADTLIPVQGASDAESYLKALGLKPQYHAYAGLPHGVNETEVKDLAGWLEKLVNAR